MQCIVFGCAEKCDVYLKEPEIRMENTFLDLARKVLVEIVNDSEYLLKYQWVRNKSLEEDKEQKERF